MYITLIQFPAVRLEAPQGRDQLKAEPGNNFFR